MRVGVVSPPVFIPTRAEGLRRLADFAPRAGRAYAETRNTDAGPDDRSNVSVLSPYLRRRLITEREVVATILSRHSFADAEKYIQEVLWRTYWKGWLEMRPAIWRRYVAELEAVRASFKGGRALDQAEAGMTGIDGFDDWARELVEHGYLHNHARMWFASIWIFTLRLPWTLGADLFMRHLVDADPASNTLSWRWVAGLQTAGKTYLATADNIARYTNGRFQPRGLATSATALSEAPVPAPSPWPSGRSYRLECPSLLLVTPEDLEPETAFPPGARFEGAVVLSDPGHGDDRPRAFVAGAARDTAARVEAHFGCPATVWDTLDTDRLLAAANDARVTSITTAYAPVGPIADRLEAVATTLGTSCVELIRPLRSWDERFWPHAKKGYFAFKEKLRPVLAQEGLC